MSMLWRNSLKHKLGKRRVSYYKIWQIQGVNKPDQTELATAP
jgi:hypothetical protein